MFASSQISADNFFMPQISQTDTFSPNLPSFQNEQKGIFNYSL